MDGAWIGAIAGVAGAAVGAAGSGGFALLRSRIEWRREGATRWNDARRQTYAAFLHAAHAVWSEGHIVPYRYHAHLKEGGAETVHETLAEWREAQDEMWRYFREIEIIGGRAVVEAAQEVANRVRDIAVTEERMLSNPSEGTLGRSAELHTETSAAFTRFKSEVRREIGIAAG